MDEAADTHALTLALETLTTFNLDEKVDEVLGIVVPLVPKLLDNQDVDVRRVAATW